jgi:hypothetical protein
MLDEEEDEIEGFEDILNRFEDISGEFEGFLGGLAITFHELVVRCE